MKHFPIAAAAGAAALLLGTPLSAHAQESDAQLWTATTASLPLSKDFELSGGLFVRASDSREGIYQLQFLGDLAMEVSEDVSVGVGYSHIPNYSGGALVRSENRLRQQVSAHLAEVAGGRISGRLRLEQRWRDDGEDVKFRLRPALTYALPVGGGTSLRLGHESFFNLNETDWGPDLGYDRMRHTIALRRGLGGGFTGEIGYLNQYIFGRDDPDQVDHVLTLAVRFDL